jgi:hypothetical protein
MTIPRVKKTAVTIGLVAVITVVSLALGVAQDHAPAGLGHSFGMHSTAPARASCLGDDYALRFGLIPKSGDSSIGLVKEAVVLPALLPVSDPLMFVPKPRKIALHLLDSVLLI